MGGDQRGEAGVADDLEQGAHHAVAGRVVEVAGRLVGQQDLGVVGERADDRDALLLAAREPRRAVPRRSAEADPVEQLRRLAARAAARGTPAIICGSMTFSSAENSGSRWWNW